MARTLIEQGDEVALLVLLDTERPRFHSFFLTAIARLRDRGEHIAEVLRQFLHPSVGTRRQAISDVLQRKLRRVRLSKNPMTTTDYIYEQRTAYQRLLKKHRLKRYPGRIKLIVSDGVYPFVGLLGWNRFADGGLEVSRTTGSHKTFRAQYSREFGQQVRLCIDRARSESEQRMASEADGARCDEVVRPEAAVS
jgi:thioesterase domain-containing protein